MNVFCIIWKEKVYSPLFFVENTFTSDSYLDMLTLKHLHQLEDDSNDFIFQQDGAPLHFPMGVWNHLNVHLFQRLISYVGASDIVWCRWLRRSPDLTLCDFFLWNYGHPASDAIFARVEAVNNDCRSFHHYGHTALFLFLRVVLWGQPYLPLPLPNSCIV